MKDLRYLFHAHNTLINKIVNYHKEFTVSFFYFQCIISQLPAKVEPGHKAVVSGTPFNVPIQPCPTFQWEVKTETNCNGSL